MILAIRISGQVGLPSNINETLHRIRIRRKYAAVLLKPTAENLKILKGLRNNIAYGEASKDLIVEIIKKRGKSLDKNQKIDAESVADQIDKKSLEKLGLKPFFRFHPPRGGIESKKHFGVGKGVLGDHKDKISELARRML